MLLSYFVIAISCLVLVSAEKAFKGKHLPSYIIPCSRSSPDLHTCAVEHGKQAIPSLLKGDPKFKIPALVPLHLDRVEVKPNSNFEMIFTNLDLYGLDNIKMKSLKIDDKTKHVDATFEGDGLNVLSDYKISGQILVLPISGEGKTDLKFDDCFFHYTLDYDVAKKGDGKEYAMITKSNIEFKINKAKFYLGNLFNGNKELGDNMNKVLNENHEAVLKDLGEAISQIIESITNRIVNSFLGAIPYDEILLP